MKMARRALFRLLGASGLITTWPVRSLFAARGARPFFLIFDDITAETPVDALETLIAPFLVAGIPVGLIVKPGDGAGARPPYVAPLAEVLRRVIRQSPDLAEIIAWLPDLGQGPPYFQIRAASAAKARLAAFLATAQDATSAPFPGLTIAGEDREGSFAVDALRAAGFRNAMLLSQAASAVVSDRCVQTVACMRGGLRHSIADGSYDLISAMRAEVGAGDMIMLVLSLKDVARISRETLHTRAATLADAIGADVQAGRIVAALPREHIAWFSTGAARLIGLALEVPPPDDHELQIGFGAMQVMLAGARLPYSLISRAPGAPGTDLTACQRVDALPELVPAAFGCALAGSLPDHDLRSLADAGLEVIVQPAAFDASGLDGNGLLHLPQIPAVSFAPKGGDAARDVVLSIPATAYATDARRAAVLDTLRQTTRDGGATILTVPGLAAAILPDDPVYRRMLATRRDMAVAPARTPITADQRAALLEDARIAWSYFAAMTDPMTGLCASTVSIEGEWSSINRALTMWDYGSLIQATMAGLALGLIGKEDYLRRASALLRGLPSENIAGLTLPSGEIASDSGKTTFRDYNACDTGRLLIALDQMNRHPASKGLFTQKVAAWDLAGTLTDGWLNSISQSQFQPLRQSHCAQYAARAFGLWGIAVRSPYAADPRDSPTDARMRLLYEIGQIGAIGAEPLLLEGVELGFSPPSAYLADVLFTAQQRSFAADGKLVCVSEGPMDRAPWFTYQGLRVDSDNDTWDVQSIDPAAAYQTPRFRVAAQTVSTKAAFLWAALRPGDYSSRLLDHVRNHARASVVGYSSGTYVATGAAMTNYTDINTNAVILQAIAHSLRDALPGDSAQP